MQILQYILSILSQIHKNIGTLYSRMLGTFSVFKNKTLFLLYDICSILFLIFWNLLSSCSKQIRIKIQFPYIPCGLSGLEASRVVLENGGLEPDWLPSKLLSLSGPPLFLCKRGTIIVPASQIFIDNYMRCIGKC